METKIAGTNYRSRVFFALFFSAMAVSIGLTYYHVLVREDYTTFTDPDAVPDPSDFFAYLASQAIPYFQK